MANHNWSGWPGAYCTKCGAEDPIEIAIADNKMDPITGKFIDEEYRIIVMEKLKCPIEDKKNNNGFQTS